MNLEEQFKLIFYSFIYGIFFLSTYKLVHLIKIKHNIFKMAFELCFCMLHVIIFYFLLYRINNGIINIYSLIFLVLGGIFCRILYYQDKNN